MAIPLLYTPGGDIFQKDVRPITRQQLIMLSVLHEFAHKEGITVVCQKCDSAITGQNNDSTLNPSVACKCREWRYTP